MTLSTLFLWIRTIRYLRPVQIYWRIWRRLWQPRPRLQFDVVARVPPQTWQFCARTPRLTGPGAATFLNRPELIHGPDIWNSPRLPKLWLYNLHYFDDLTADGFEQRAQWHKDLIGRWIAENPPGHGNGWEPYPTSLRIVNWVKWHNMTGALTPDALRSLAVQADWLGRNLEYHLLGNHLLANAKALVFAASAFEGPRAAAWRAKGLAILQAELAEQVLPAGGHFERSTMYHAIFVEDLLDLVQLATLDTAIDLRVSDAWRNTAAQALCWLEAMCHPDGQIAFFNDAAFAIAPEPGALHDYARALGVAVKPPATPDNDGYVRLETGPALLLCDAAAIGPDHLPGHAHADTLSFEMSLKGQRLIGNGGTSVYGDDPSQRQAERSTSAHNTVEVDGQNSSEIWSSFRVARRARIVTRSLHLLVHRQELSAAHDGFVRFGGPIHHRTWVLEPSRLIITDLLEGPWREACGRLRVLPGWTATPDEITGPARVHLRVEGAKVRMERGSWTPEFGKVVPCDILCYDFERPKVAITLSWEA